MQDSSQFPGGAVAARCAVVAAVLGAISLVTAPTPPPLPTAGLGIVAGSLALWLLSRPGPGWTSAVSRVAAASLLTAGTSELAGDALGVDLGLAPNTALAFVCLGVALAGIALGDGVIRRLARRVAGVALLIAFIALTGLAYGVVHLYRLPRFVGMNLPTALGVAALSIGALALRPGRASFASVLARRSAGGTMARLLLPVALVLPLALGWVWLQGAHRGLYDVTTGVSLLVAAIAALLVGIIGRAALQLERFDAQRDAAFGREQVARGDLAAIVDSSVDGIITMAPDGTVRTWNTAAERIFGCSAAEMVGHPIFDLIPESHHADERRILGWLSSGLPVARYESVRVRKDGCEIAAALSVSPLRDARGAVTGALAIVRDITAERLADIARRRREEEYRTAFELSPVGQVRTDPRTGSLLRANQAFCELTGYSSEELRRMTVADLTYPDDRADDRAAVNRLLRGETTREEREKRYVRKDGRLVWVNMTISLVRDGEANDAYTAAVIQDITARKTAEAALAASQAALRDNEERLHRSLAIARAGTWEWEVETDRMTLSPEYEALYGRAPGSLRRVQDFVDAVHPEDRATLEAVIRGALVEGGVHEAEFRVVWPDGTVRWLRYQGQATCGAAGRAVRIGGAIMDITDWRRAEEEARQSQRLQAVGKLAGGMAHEVNNMMTAVIGFGEFALCELPPAHPQRDDVQEMVKAAKRAAQVTQQVLAFSRQQVLQPVVLDLNGVVEELRPVLRRLLGADVSLMLDLAPDLVPIWADRGQLEQVLINLVANARDAMPEGGHVVIQTRTARIDDNGDTERPPGRYAMLVVTDTGIGMDAATRAQAFEPFFTTKPTGRGTGLGLATVHGIVKQSGGDVWLYSKLGHGTSVKLLLPATIAAPAAAERNGEEAPAPRASGTILVVDDEPMVRTMARRALQAEGYRVLEATSGREAVALLGAGGEGQPCCTPDGSTVDLVLCDVVMSELNGKAVGEYLAVECPTLPVLFMSGYTGEDVRARGLLPDDSALIPKPFSPGELARRVREALAG